MDVELTTFTALSKEYEVYIKALKAKWLASNQVSSRNVLEVMSDLERRGVRGVMAEYATYITPLAEAWWKERGYSVEWPDDNSQPMKVIRIEGS